MNIFNKLSNTSNLTNNEKLIVKLILEKTNEFLKMDSETNCRECFAYTTHLFHII